MPNTNSNNAATVINPATKAPAPKVGVEEQVRLDVAQTNKEMGLFLPKNLNTQMTLIWEEFFDLLRWMYRFDVIHLQYVKKYLYDFFEIGKGQSDEPESKKLALGEMWEKAKIAIDNKKELMSMFYQEQYIKNMENFYENLETDEEKIGFLNMIYEGNLPPEVQDAIDGNEMSKLTPEEMEEIQRQALAEATSKYQGKRGLNLGQSGTVLTAAEIADFVDLDGDGDNDLEELPEVKTVTRTLPSLPSNSNFGNVQRQVGSNNMVNFEPNLETEPTKNTPSASRPPLTRGILEPNSSNQNPPLTLNPDQNPSSTQFQNKFGHLRNLPNNPPK